MGPVLKRVDGDDDQDFLAFCVPQKTIDEGDHLESFTKTHAMGQDASEALTFVELKEGTNEIRNL